MEGKGPKLPGDTWDVALGFPFICWQCSVEQSRDSPGVIYQASESGVVKQGHLSLVIEGAMVQREAWLRRGALALHRN